MAHDFHTQKIVDNVHKTIIKYTAICDGASGELSKAILFDASAYTPAATQNGVQYIDAVLVGCSAMLYWDSSATDVPLIGLPPDHSHRNDLREDDLPYLQNDVGTTATGDILISTNGFTAVGDTISVILSVIKTGV